MGFRFRKSIKMGPVRVNFSKRGVGYSVGCKGFRVTKRADGRIQKTYSIPGTGISYVDVQGNKPKKSYSVTDSLLDYSNIKSSNENKANGKVLKNIFLFFITGGLYLYYVCIKWIISKVKKISNKGYN